MKKKPKWSESRAKNKIYKLKKNRKSNLQQTFTRGVNYNYRLTNYQKIADLSKTHEKYLRFGTSTIALNQFQFWLCKNDDANIINKY
jgi:hypothetical protein